MPYELEETGELARTATVTVPQAEFQKEMNSALKEIADDVDMEGFRKGKVPMSVVKRKYGRQVQGDVIERLVRQGIQDILDNVEEDILYLGQPEVTQIPEDEESNLVFSVDLELAPTVDPVGYLGLEVERPTPEVDREEVDEQLEQMREQFAETEPIEFRETIQDGDVVTFDFEPTSDDEALEAFRGEDVEVEIGSGRALPEIEEALDGADFGATLTTTLTLDDSYPEEELRGEDVEIRMTIESVEQRVKPELNDELAQKTGEAETLLELRGKIKEQMLEQREHQADHAAEDNLVDVLVEQHDMELPPQFVDQQVEREMERRKEMFQQQGLDVDALGMSDEEFAETTREDVVRNIKSDFLLTAIANAEQLEVEEEDLDRFFEHQAQHNQQFGAEQLKQFYQQDEERWENAVYQARLDKAKKLLLSEAEFDEVPWSEGQPQGPEGLDEDSSDAEGLDEDSSDAEGLDEDSSDVEDDG